MTAELFTVATKVTSGLERLQMSLAKFEVPMTILGQGEAEFWGYGWRWKTFIRALNDSASDTVVHCDAYDTMCLEPLDSLLAKFATFSHPIVFGYEAQDQPEFWLGLNPGLMMADRKALLDVFDDKTLEELFPNHFNDMYQLQSLYSWYPSTFTLDRQGTMFHTLSPRSPELVVQDNKLINPATGLAPSFIHAPYGRDLAKVEQFITAA